MQLATNGKSVIQDLKQSSAFGIQMNAKMYSILTDKLYTDKPGAVIRELSANALDAHKEAGTTDKQFDIKVPTIVDPNFYIRDYGTGIDPDLFEGIYTNLGNSTKDQSDEYIGAYGLGSKTPFALVEAYTVEDYYEGTLTVFQCFKEHGMPQVSKVGSHATDEPNGLRISFPLGSENADRLRNSILTQLANFPIVPNVIGISAIFTERVDLSDGWGIADEVHRGDFSVVVGGITYPTNWYDLSVGYRDHSDLRKLNLVIDVPLGCVDIPPSRESLEYTDKTTQYLIGRFKEISLALKKKATAEFCTVANAVEAYQCTERYEYHDHKVFRVVNGYRLEMTRNPLSCDENDDQTFLQTHRVYKGKRDNASTPTVQMMRDGEVYINDVGSRAWAILKEEPKRDIIYVTKGFTRKDEKASSVAAAKYDAAKLGLKIKMLSTIVTLPEPVAKGQAVKRIADQVFLITTIRSEFPSLAPQAVVPSSGWYVDLTREGVTNKNVVDLVGLLPDGTTIYGLRSKARKIAEKLPNLISIDTLIPKLMVKYRKDYFLAQKRDAREGAFNSAGMHCQFARRVSPKFEYPSLALTQALGIFIEKRFPGDPLHFIKKKVEAFDPEFKPEMTYTLNPRFQEAVDWVKEYMPSMINSYQYPSESKIVTINKLINHLGNTE